MLWALLLAGLAGGRCLTILLPESWFDVDPVIDPTGPAGLVPLWVVGLDIVMLLAAAAALIMEGVRGRGVPLWMVLLWAAPVGPFLLHASRTTADLQAGLPWLAGATTAVALACVCRDGRVRRLVVATLCAVAAPIAIEAVVQKVWTLPDAAAAFRQNPDLVLQSMGLAPGSAEALVFARRLSTQTPTAWFSSPNLLATVMAACAVLLMAMVASAKRQGRSSLTGAMLLVAALGAAAAVGMAHSLGGLIVLLIGFTALIGGMVWPHARQWGGMAALVMIGLAAAAPLVAWTIGPEASVWESGRSLLIRGQYHVGALAVAGESPLVGVGPAGFQDAYMAARVPGAPEEVTSAHAMLIDWPAMLGLLGLGWVALVVVQLVRAGVSRSEEALDSGGGRGWWVLAGSVLLIPPLLGACAEWPTIDAGQQIVRVIGWVAAIALLLALSRVRIGRDAQWGIFCAAFVLVLQANVDMGLHNAATSVWVLAVLGAAAPVPDDRGVARSFLAGGIVAALAVAMVSVGWWPLRAQERLVGEAAVTLIVAPGDAGPQRHAQVRGHAADLLVEAWSHTHDPRLISHAATQQLAAVSDLPSEQAAALLRSAARTAKLAEESLPAARIRLEALWGLARLTGSQDVLGDARLLSDQIASRDPSAPWSWASVAWIAEQQGDLDVAATAARRAMQLDEALAIDPIQRLPEDVRADLLRMQGSLWPH